MSKKRNRIPYFPHWAVESRFPGGFTFRDEANALVKIAIGHGPLAEILSDPSSTDDEAAADMNAVLIHAARALEDWMTAKFYAPDEYYHHLIRDAGSLEGYHRGRQEDREFMAERKKAKRPAPE